MGSIPFSNASPSFHGVRVFPPNTPPLQYSMTPLFPFFFSKFPRVSPVLESIQICDRNGRVINQLKSQHHAKKAQHGGLEKCLRFGPYLDDENAKRIATKRALKNLQFSGSEYRFSKLSKTF